MATTTVALKAVRGEIPAGRWIVIVVLGLGMVIHYVSRSALAVPLALPDFIRSFHLSNTDRGVLNSAFFWTYAALQLPAGWIVDRYGVKFPYLVSFALWGVVSASTALTHSVPQLLVVQVLLGVGQAVITPASYRWIRFHFLEKERGLAIGLYMTGTKIGPAIGAPLAAWLIARYDWRLIFVLIGVVGIALLVPWGWLVRDDDRQLAKSITSAEGAKPIPFGKIMASPVIWGIVIASFCYMYFVYFSLTWMPAYFIERRHLPPAKMGLYTFLSFGGMTIIALLGGWGADLLIGRGSRPTTVRKWFTIAGFALACTELIGARAASLEVALIFAVFSLSGLGLATANYWAITQTLIPGPAIGRITGVQNCACSLAGIAAPILTGWLLQKTGVYEAPMTAILVVMLVGILSYLLLIREEYAPK